MPWLSKLLTKLFSIRDQQEKDTDVVKPFLDHLEDLRIVLFKMAFVLAVGMAIGYWFRDDLMRLVTKPLPPGVTLITIGIAESFMLSLKLAFYAGIVISFPALLYFAADFILPALTRRERRLVLPGILLGFLLFGFGVVISYNFVLPRTIEFFFHYSDQMNLKILPQAGPYFAFVTHLTLACGLLCELPIVMIALALLNILTYELLARTRAYAIVLIGILIAIVSPSPDPMTFVILALPVFAVYEACIWIVWLIERRKAAALPE